MVWNDNMSALDILPALVNPPSYYKLGVSAVQFTGHFVHMWNKQVLASSTCTTLLFCDLAERKEPAERKTEKRVCVPLVNHLSAWLMNISILWIMILFTGMLHAKKE